MGTSTAQGRHAHLIADFLMIALEKCRILLGEKSAHLTDKQVESLRDDLYELVQLCWKLEYPLIKPNDKK